MTRVICVAPLIDSARLFMQSELGWEIEERDELVADADAAVAIVEAAPLGQAELDVLPALRLIVSVRGEPVNVDLAAATARGIPVVHAPGRNAESVAEFTIGVMIALLRRIVSTHELVRRRVLTEDRSERVRPRGDVIWRPADSTATVPYRAFKGPGLRSTKLGLLGLGAIGGSVAGLANALGMRVIGHDPYLAGELSGVELVSFEELLEESDVLSLHARGSGAQLIGAAELSRMRPGALLINTARATILDYEALAGALRSGRLAGAALDVYPDEPLTPDDPLLDLDNVILTPHIAGASLDVARRQWEILEAGLRALLLDCRAGDAPIRNPEAIPSFDIPGSDALSARETQHDALLGKVARLHYEHALTHQEVAEILQISRVKATRSWPKRGGRGIVEIRIHSEASPYADLELDVARRFGLDEAIIVPAMKAPEQQRESLAIAVAGYLQRVLRDGMVVAIGISRTIGLVADNIVESRVQSGARSVSVTAIALRPLRASRTTRPTAPAGLAVLCPRNIPAPVYAATKELRDAFVCDPAIARPLEQAAGADLILVGAGGLGNQLLVSGGEIQDDQLKELVAAGAVGDIAARFFDESGRAVEHDLDQRLIGLTLAQIAGIRTRVVAAGGSEKVAALEVLLGAGLATVLVTDAATAAALIHAGARRERPAAARR